MKEGEISLLDLYNKLQNIVFMLKRLYKNKPELFGLFDKELEETFNKL